MVRFVKSYATFRIAFGLLAVAIVIVCYNIVHHADRHLLQVSGAVFDPFKVPLGNVSDRTDLGNRNILPIPGASKPKPTIIPLTESELVPDREEQRKALADALLWRADATKTVIVSIVDAGYLDMALNFLEESIDKFHFKNFFPVCLDNVSKSAMETAGYDCLLYRFGTKSDGKASDFGTDGYFWKTNVKTWITLEVLRLGYNVLFTDIDIVLFKKPFPYLNCSTCDIVVQMDREMYNSGFVYVRATDASRAVYEDAWQRYLRYHKSHDQAYFNSALRYAVSKGDISVKELPRNLFVCGVYYFQNDFRNFNNQPECPDCVMVHNNYIGSTEAKIYRFKENLMWVLDRNGYYSSRTAQYLLYENPYDFSADTIEQERKALVNALMLGKLTQRIVILPSFRCCSCKQHSCEHPRHRCSLISILNAKAFDEQFGNLYREHSFLEHPKVPAEVKTSLSPVIKLKTNNIGRHSDVSGLVLDKKFTASRHETHSLQTIQDVENISQTFKSFSVLRFHSLYGEFAWGPSKDIENIENGLRCSDYEQWSETVESQSMP